jgi:hypothetical protein
MDKFEVPQNLIVHELEKIFPSVDVPGFHKDKVYFVCQAISRGMGRLGEDYIHPEKTKKYFVPLHSRVLGRALGKNNYHALMEWMEAANIIISDGSWHDHRVSQGYRFTDKYLFSEMTWKTATNWPIQRKELIDCFDHKFYFQKAVVRGLKKWFKTKKLSIDSKAAYDTIKKQRAAGLRKANGRPSAVKLVKLMTNDNTRKVSAIENHNYLFEQDEFGYRLHTSITQLPKEFRHLIRYNGIPLVEVDISCSQLFFSNFIMDERHWITRGNKSRNKNLDKIWEGVGLIRNKYIEQHNDSRMCLKSFENSYSKGFEGSYFQKKTKDGKLYESIVDKLDSQHFLDRYATYEDKRQHVKDILLQQLYADPRKARHRGLYMGENLLIWQCFSILYPNEAHLFELAKKAYYKDLCMLLQRIEATAILGYVCKRLLKDHPEIPIFTLHDCLVTTAGNETLVKQIMEEEIKQFMGIVPGMKIKDWK